MLMCLQGVCEGTPANPDNGDTLSDDLFNRPGVAGAVL